MFMECFATKSRGFESENLCFLNMYSVQAASILDLSLEIMLSPPK